MIDNKELIEKEYYSSWSKEQLIQRIKKLEKLTQDLKDRSMHDCLTKVYNYRTIIDIIENKIKYFNYRKEIFSILMIDIDDFKKINDNFGHVFGDEVLMKVANEIKRNIRKDDCIGRFGGEEFIIIFNNTKLDEAIKISERIRKSIEKAEFFPSLKVTISGGIKEYSDEICKEIVNSADDLLYKAKRSGKNKICY